MIEAWPPFMLFYAAGIAALVLRGSVRSAVMLAVPIAGAVNVASMDHGVLLQVEFMDNVLAPVRVDRLSLLFGYLFHLAAFIAIAYSIHVRDTFQQVAAVLYIGSALGAVFAGDLLSLFVFWELMALTSVFLILASKTQAAIRSAMRYLVFQVFSGVLLLAGALIQLHQTGSLEFGYIGLHGLSSWLIFLALGVKCGFPFLHTWLTDAYPQATPTGAVFLSAFTTKVAVYALARGFPGTELLVYIGAVMTCFPIFYAVIENDLRRVLVYSMINQLGFMVCGIGIGTALAVNGAVAHAFNDVIFKGLLMMSMGAVLYRTGRINGSDLGGLYKSMPITTVLCLVGAASISAFPLFSGFVSKSMVMSAALEQDFDWVWLVLLFASAGVFHHAGIKIPFFAFFAHDSGIRTTEAPRNMLIAMGFAAGICILIGTNPRVLYAMLPFETTYSAYDYTHVVAQLQLLFFSALAFIWLKQSGLYPPELRSVNLDADWFSRRVAYGVLNRLGMGIARVDSAFRSTAQQLVQRVLALTTFHGGANSGLARAWTTGSALFFAATVLAGLLIYSYV